MGQLVQPDVLSAAAATAGRRHREAVETAAYLLVTEAIEDAAGRSASYAAVCVSHRDGRLTVKPTWMRTQIPCG
jgi:hypothetical protein